MISVRVTSFGYGHAGPPAAAITLDVRTLLHNPHHDPAMRHLTGRDPAVGQHVMNTPGAIDLVSDTVVLARNLLHSAGRSGLRVDVAVGCVGGRHRSVVLAQEISLMLELHGVGTEVQHRDIDKPVLTPSRSSN